MQIIYQYSVKFICGKTDGDVVASGIYFTAINVHNPTYRGVKFRKKFAIACPGERAGPVIDDSFYAKLGPDQALEIDCPDIREHTKNASCEQTRDGFVKGFVVIESEVELDVVAVYTAAGKDGFVETLHTERVSPRRIEECLPDLVPVPDENGSFCRRKDGTLIVTVKNQGACPAGRSVTQVDFGQYGQVSMPTPGLSPGESVDLGFPIPTGCFDPDCEFRITVDVNNDVEESDEGNNFASDRCIG